VAEPDGFTALDPVLAEETTLQCGCKAFEVVERAIQSGGFEPGYQGGARIVTSVGVEYRPCANHLGLVPVVRERYAAKTVREGELFTALVKVLREVTRGR
jgi:hypothetical protein